MPTPARLHDFLQNPVISVQGGKSLTRLRKSDIKDPPDKQKGNYGASDTAHLSEVTVVKKLNMATIN
jgi:hypothetical protein